MADKDDLFKNIDDAADNLFSQYLVKKPAPTAPAATSAAPPSEDSQITPPIQPPTAPPPEPIAPSAATQATSGPPLDLDLEISLAEPLDLGQGEDVMAKMEEALMSIDWEVSPKNLTKGREILASLVSKHGFAPDSPARQVSDQMDKVLSSMLQSPEGIPVSAPSLLKKALEAIKVSIASAPTVTPEIRKLLSQALSELNAVLAAPQPAESVALDFNLQMEGGAPEPPHAVPTKTQEKLSPAPAPMADFGMDLSLESEAAPSGIGQAVAEDITQILRAYSATLATAIKSITPMVNLFANRTGMEKLHDVTEHVREKLSGQERLLSQTFSADYSQYNGIGTVKGWLESQLDILNPCVKRLTKVETLFAKSKGYEKVYELTKKVRKSLTEQQEAITTAVGGAPIAHQFDMTGEYPALQPVLARTPEASPAAISAVTNPQTLLDSCIVLAKKIAQGEESGPDIARKLQDLLEKTKAALAGSAIASPSATAAALSAVASATTPRPHKCRWDWLLKTTWAGQLVGMAPEQVAFESQATFPLKNFSGKTHFPLKKLKSMPWTNLQALFSGELAEIDKTTLNSMELEIAQPPETFRGSSQKKVHVMILYHNGIGKVFLVETPTEAISITDEGIWNPGRGGSEIAGTLTVYGSIMPVIAID